MSIRFSHRLIATATMSSMLLSALGACNAITGADDIVFVDQSTSPAYGNGSDMNFGFTTGSGGDHDDHGFEACATASDEAKLMTINMYIAVDKSGSMGSNNKWNNARSAFNTFFKDPAADSINVALRFWPDQSCNGNTCNNNDACINPLVSLGSLADDQHQSALVAAFNAQHPGGGTPMSAALDGATEWCVNNQESNQGTELSVVVLLSDGAPTQCNQNTKGLTNIARKAYEDAGVLTFAVGLQGSNEHLMNSIAQAGQTEKGYFIGNGNTQEELLAALKDIQKNVTCAFAMPQTEDEDDIIDPTQVNVTHTRSGSSEPTVLSQMRDEADCGQSGDGWYYDDPVAPKVIKLCPATCAEVQNDPGAKIEIVVGCETIVN